MRTFWGVMEVFCVLIVAIVIKLCTFVRLIKLSVKGVSFIVDQLYLNRLDFKKYISPSKPTIFQMGKQAPDEGNDLLQL